MTVLELRPLPMQDDHVKQLVAVLGDIYWRADPAVIIVVEVGFKKADFFWDREMSLVWPDIVREAAERGCLRQLIETVAQKAEAQAWAAWFTTLLSLPQLREWYRAPDAYDATFVGPGGSSAFIDRAELRHLLRGLVQGEARVLIVGGPPDSGRSHTTQLLTHLVANEPRFELALVDMSKWKGPPATPIDVVRRIASEMRLEAPPVDVHALPDNQANVLARSLLDGIHNGKRTWLLVFDGIDRANLRPEAFRMIETIAVDSARRSELPLRVVLLGYDRLLPGGAERAAVRETIRPIARPRSASASRTRPCTSAGS